VLLQLVDLLVLAGTDHGEDDREDEQGDQEQPESDQGRTSWVDLGARTPKF